jgi:hypothetical protein
MLSGDVANVDATEMLLLREIEIETKTKNMTGLNRTEENQNQMHTIPWVGWLGFEFFNLNNAGSNRG